MYVSNSLSEAVGWEMCNVNVRCSQNTKLTCVCVCGGGVCLYLCVHVSWGVKGGILCGCVRSCQKVRAYEKPLHICLQLRADLALSCSYTPVVF